MDSLDDVNDVKFINLSTDAVNVICKNCKEKCKQSCKVTVVCCPNKTNKRS